MLGYNELVIIVFLFYTYLSRPAGYILFICWYINVIFNFNAQYRLVWAKSQVMSNRQLILNCVLIGSLTFVHLSGSGALRPVTVTNRPLQLTLVITYNVMTYNELPVKTRKTSWRLKLGISDFYCFVLLSTYSITSYNCIIFNYQHVHLLLKFV